LSAWIARLPRPAFSEIHIVNNGLPGEAAMEEPQKYLPETGMPQ